MSLQFPGGKRCAFSIFDDTDVATLKSIRPVYDFLSELGILTTKTVWALDYEGASDYEGSETLGDEDYADYMKELKRRGFEIGFHGARMESSTRVEIERGLRRYLEVFGEYPRINAAHGQNRDNLYWGPDRFSSSFMKWIYLLRNQNEKDYYQGHLQGSPFFWGDLSREHFKYVRSFTFTGIDLLKWKLPLVYSNNRFPWVNAWFLSCDAENVEEFNALLDTPNQEELEGDGGLCIITTHLGKGFVADDRVNSTTRKLLEQLSKRSCWFAPVSKILDFYVTQCGCQELSARQLRALEWKWFVNSIRRRKERRSYNPTELDYLKRRNPN